MNALCLMSVTLPNELSQSDCHEARDRFYHFVLANDVCYVLFNEQIHKEINKSNNEPINEPIPIMKQNALSHNL